MAAVAEFTVRGETFLLIVAADQEHAIKVASPD
jgi:hypothetical protein